MISALTHIARLARAGFVFAREGVFGTVDPTLVPPPGQLALRLASKATPRCPWIDMDRLGAVPADPTQIERIRGHPVRSLSTLQLLRTSLPVQLHWCDRRPAV